MSEAVPQSSKKQRGIPFQKGRSGNPAGRKPKTEQERQLDELCREKTLPALTTVFTLMESGEAKVRLNAAQYVLDRGWGKAPQNITLHAGESFASILAGIKMNGDIQ
jgi:hypothetical protein